jgi:hypothetical protein
VIPKTPRRVKWFLRSLLGYLSFVKLLEDEFFIDEFYQKEFQYFLLLMLFDMHEYDNCFRNHTC